MDYGVQNSEFQLRLLFGHKKKLKRRQFFWRHSVDVASFYSFRELAGTGHQRAL